MEEEHDWAYNRKGFPIYCTHCTFMNEILPSNGSANRSTPSDPPSDFDRDPCTWYWFKDPARHPRPSLGALRARARLATCLHSPA
jgi:hypothetical protein